MVRRYPCRTEMPGGTPVRRDQKESQRRTDPHRQAHCKRRWRHPRRETSKSQGRPPSGLPGYLSQGVPQGSHHRPARRLLKPRCAGRSLHPGAHSGRITRGQKSTSLCPVHSAKTRRLPAPAQPRLPSPPSIKPEVLYGRAPPLFGRAPNWVLFSFLPPRISPSAESV